MNQTFLFLPAPRRLSYTQGQYTLPENSLILLDGPEPQRLRPAGARFQHEIERLGLTWQETASATLPAGEVG
ncbi:MAG TPA: hypothetical protein VFM46_03825, partial [Pseudomonadales bacterium]|nr:hypothetical protein [Pseudomonadales bacterium]